MKRRTCPIKVGIPNTLVFFKSFKTCTEYKLCSTVQSQKRRGTSKECFLSFQSQICPKLQNLQRLLMHCNTFTKTPTVLDKLHNQELIIFKALQVIHLYCL